MGREKNNTNKKQYEEDLQDMHKSFVRQNKPNKKRKKKKQDLNWLIKEDESAVEDYYDTFEKW
tara:strand:+ start:71 stop:259 length:189 start_codon:yes stop_codon:yes gene_type:complete